jgi:hypothetical protein
MNNYGYNLFEGVFNPMYELPEDGSDVPELVTGMRLSYVHLFGFTNEYFSVVYAVVITVLAVCVA